MIVENVCCDLTYTFINCEIVRKIKIYSSDQHRTTVVQSNIRLINNTLAVKDFKCGRTMLFSHVWRDTLNRFPLKFSPLQPVTHCFSIATDHHMWFIIHDQSRQHYSWFSSKLIVPRVSSIYLYSINSSQTETLQ